MDYRYYWQVLSAGYPAANQTLQSYEAPLKIHNFTPKPPKHLPQMNTTPTLDTGSQSVCRMYSRGTLGTGAAKTGSDGSSLSFTCLMQDSFAKSIHSAASSPGQTLTPPLTRYVQGYGPNA
jgi:hypothetical protein